MRVGSKSGGTLDVKVPAAAKSGQVVVETAAGIASHASSRVTIKVVKAATALSATLPAPKLAAVAGIAALDAGISTRKAGKGVSAVQVAYVSHAPETVGVRVDVVRAADGVSIFSESRSAAPEKQQTLTWEGRGSAAPTSPPTADTSCASPPAPRSAPAAATSSCRAAAASRSAAARRRRTAPSSSAPSPSSAPSSPFAARTTTARARPPSAPAATATRTRART